MLLRDSSGVNHDTQPHFWMMAYGQEEAQEEKT